MTSQMLDYVLRGGIVMVPILICSVLALIIIIERLWSLRRKRIFRLNILDTIEHLLYEQRIAEAAMLFKPHSSGLSGKS